MSWVPVTPKPRFLEWTGENLAEWQDRWPNAWVVGTQLFYGPTIGPVEVGGGMVEGGGVLITYFTAAEFAENFTVDPPAPEPEAAADNAETPPAPGE
ncbi:hypothetical protein [Amycolatopsis tolypomycina]|uniref:hypothetical protein n=1 Tax=Amycolatopsis tolypomycina TaxID=208445 RepID=UPI0033BEDD7D